MSFRGRLLVFFTIIVVIPMIAVALVLFSLTEDSEHGKVDARLASGLRTTLSFYERGAGEARAVRSARVASDDELTQALRARDDAAVERRLRELAAANAAHRVGRLLHARAAPKQRPPARATAVAAATVEPTTADGERLGTLAVSVTPADELARQSCALHRSRRALAARATACSRPRSRAPAKPRRAPGTSTWPARSTAPACRRCASGPAPPDADPRPPGRERDVETRSTRAAC